MLLRRIDGHVTGISQPAHAWLAGDLARAWGGRGFAVPEPRDPVIAATSLHDIGWLDWERRPVLNPATGWPQQFDEVAAERHVDLWRDGVAKAGVFGPYVALLVSRHGDFIYEKSAASWTTSPVATAVVHAFLAEQAAHQDSLIRSLRDDPWLRNAVEPQQLALGKRFLAALDSLSLVLCGGFTGEKTVPVPGSTGTDVALRLACTDAATVRLQPWPFQADRVDLRVSGKRLDGPFGSQNDLDKAFAATPPHSVEIALEPG